MGGFSNPSNASRAARDRWAKLTPEQRSAALAPAIERAAERRRAATALLAAVEAAGFELVPIASGAT